MYFLVKSNYDLFINEIIEFLEEKTNDEVVHESSSEDDDIKCNLFNMYIESIYKNSECDLEFTKEYFNVETDLSIFVNLFTATMDIGINLLFELLKKIEQKKDCNIMIQDNSSSVVYIKTIDKKYVNQSFWSR